MTEKIALAALIQITLDPSGRIDVATGGAADTSEIMCMGLLEIARRLTAKKFADAEAGTRVTIPQGNLVVR